MTDKTQPDSGRATGGVVEMLHASIAELQARVQELGAMARENRSRRIVELEAQLEAVGAGGVQALSAAPEAIAKLRHLYQNMVNGAVRDTASAKRIAEGLLAPAIEALERATPPAEQQAEESCVKLLADCRDAFPVPEHGSPIENEWIAAVGSHEAVPAYLQAVAKQQTAPKAAPGERLTREQIREVFMANGFTVKEGQSDLKQYVYDAAHALLELVAASQQKPCQTCIAMARTVMMDQVSFDRKPDCYGIRQVTDDEGVEEWEDIRTSPDVAREEARDMMATGRGEIYEVVPLWTTPQPAPAPLSEMPYEKRKAIQEGEQIGASDAWFKARHEMLDTVDRRNVFRAGFDRGWSAALAAQGGSK